MTSDELYAHVCILLEERYCRFINRQADARHVNARFHRLHPVNNNHIFWLYEGRQMTHYYAIPHAQIVAWKNGHPIKISSGFFKPFVKEMK